MTNKCSKTGKSESFGFKRLLIDHDVFRYEDSEGNVMILLHYVDDLVITTTSLKIRDLFLTHVNRKWKTTTSSHCATYGRDGIVVSQSDRLDRVRHKHCEFRRQVWIECTQQVFGETE